MKLVNTLFASFAAAALVFNPIVSQANENTKTVIVRGKGEDTAPSVRFHFNGTNGTVVIERCGWQVEGQRCESMPPQKITDFKVAIWKLQKNLHSYMVARNVRDFIEKDRTDTLAFGALQFVGAYVGGLTGTLVAGGVGVASGVGVGVGAGVVTAAAVAGFCLQVSDVKRCLKQIDQADVAKLAQEAGDSPVIFESAGTHYDVTAIYDLLEDVLVRHK